uniref:Uncharacterized protein n=1 Tax=Rhizophora mucronata TaxID=61149 RepID=A0A2P2QIN5_RHIMU
MFELKFMTNFCHVSQMLNNVLKYKQSGN